MSPPCRLEFEIGDGRPGERLILGFGGLVAWFDACIGGFFGDASLHSFMDSFTFDY